MKNSCSALLLLLICNTSLFSQNITKFGVSISTKCKLDLYTTNNTAPGEKMSIYQCSVSSGNNMTIYRLNIIEFNNPVTYSDSYINDLKSQYSAVGKSSIIAINGKKVVQVEENQYIEGNLVKQVSLSTVHKGNSVTFVLVTTLSNFQPLLADFKANIKFL